MFTLARTWPSPHSQHTGFSSLAWQKSDIPWRNCLRTQFEPSLFSPFFPAWDKRSKKKQRCQASCQSPIRPGRAIFSEMMSRWAMQLRFSQRKGVRMSYTSFDAYSLFGRWRTLNQSLITCCKLRANVAPTKHKKTNLLLAKSSSLFDFTWYYIKSYPHAWAKRQPFKYDTWI